MEDGGYGSFFGWDYKLVDEPDMRDVIVGGNESKIINCHFVNLALGIHNLIGGCSEDRDVSFQIENCHFEEIKTSGQILNRRHKYYERGVFRDKWVDGIIKFNTQNCTGL